MLRLLCFFKLTLHWEARGGAGRAGRRCWARGVPAREPRGLGRECGGKWCAEVGLPRSGLDTQTEEPQRGPGTALL